MSFSAIDSITIAVMLLLIGYGFRSKVPLLDRLNLPAPVIGGLLAALTGLGCASSGTPLIYDTSLQQPLMIAFFTSVGFGASLRVLRLGGRAVLLLLILSSVLAILQGLVGSVVATAFGLPALLGVLASTVTLSGGPATGLAFAPQFAVAGVNGAAAIATAVAMSGILLASICSSPLATAIIRRKDLHREIIVSDTLASSNGAEPKQADALQTALLAGALILIAMWAGRLLSNAIEAAGIVLPAYVGAMLIAALFRNIDELLLGGKLPLAAINLAGLIALSLFLVMAMMTLDLRLLNGLALPLLIGLAAQLVLTCAFILGPIWWLMGRDYEAAVTSGGVAGYMLGTTANAMAAMQAVAEKYGPAPRAFFAVPLVGSFFLDFTNAVIITAFLNFFR